MSKTSEGARSYTIAQARELLGLAGPSETRALLDRMGIGSGATPRQVAALERFGIVDGSKISLLQAGGLLNELYLRVNTKMCTLKQLGLLVDLGFPAHKARSLSYSAASRALLDARARAGGS